MSAASNLPAPTKWCFCMPPTPALRAVYLAVWGLQDHNAEMEDLGALSDLLTGLEHRLQERGRQVARLRGSEPADAEA